MPALRLYLYRFLGDQPNIPIYTTHDIRYKRSSRIAFHHLSFIPRRRRRSPDPTRGPSPPFTRSI